MNISLDTLNPERFLQITRRNGFKQVQKSIAKALEQPDLNVKINFVPIQNLNENEVVDFVEMTREKRLEVRFIEYMPFDGNRWSWEKMVSYKQLLSQIVKHFGESNVKPVAPKSPNETSRMYRVDGFTGTFGFISSMTNAFCSSCNRIRITADGNLKVTTMINDFFSHSLTLGLFVWQRRSLAKRCTSIWIHRRTALPIGCGQCEGQEEATCR